MKTEKGFSLLEVMIGLLILAIGLLGIASMTTVGIFTNANAGHLTEAYQSAQAEMEKLRLVPWGSVANGSNVKSFRGINYSNSWTVTTNGNMKNIVLSVAWNDGINHNIELKTKIAR